MSKRSVFTSITPLPPNISRQTALSFLHNHVEMIDLNPLIKERHPIPAPDHAEPDERTCAWYSLTDRISYLPGGVMSGEVSYTCAFHDLPDGLQTHCYAPMGLDIRDKWTVAGSLPGEPQQPVELGLDAPRTGLYIREDVDLRCNIFMAGFVKKTLRKAHATLTETLAAKAHSIASNPRPRHASHSPPSGARRSSPAEHLRHASAEQPRRTSPPTSGRRASPRTSNSYARNPQVQAQAQAQTPTSASAPARRQSPQSCGNKSPRNLSPLNTDTSAHTRSVSAGAPARPYQMPPQQQLQIPFQEQASWRESNNTGVPQRMGTQYHGPSRPQDYADFANMNPYESAEPAGPPAAAATQQYRPYSSHKSTTPPPGLPPVPMQYRINFAELE